MLNAMLLPGVPVLPERGQRYPFAQPFLKAGEKYDTKTVYRFLVK